KLLSHRGRRGRAGETLSPYSPQPPRRCRVEDKRGSGPVHGARRRPGGAKMRNTR
ncbi:Hypothetical predicted protein, partial [Marmota monax]